MTKKKDVYVLLLCALLLVFVDILLVTTSEVFMKSTMATPSPSVRIVQPTAMPYTFVEKALPNGVEITDHPMAVFTYRVNQSGHKNYAEQGQLDVGSLVILSACTSGWAQIEYQPDPKGQPGYWRVGWIPCDGGQQ